jgi:hypothetical protein
MDVLNSLRAPYLLGFQNSSMMTAPLEQAYCHWLTKERYSGTGQIVELGCFLGSLSRALLNGLAENSVEAAREAKVQVYDHFHWDPVMSTWTEGLELSRRPKVGENYQWLYEEFMADSLSKLDISTIDFITQQPALSEPVEVLVVDVMKSLEIANNVAQAFFPKMIPGGMIVHQDYLHFYHGWIHLLTWRLRHRLKLSWLGARVALVALEVTEAIPEEECRVFQASPEEAADEIIEAYAWNRAVFPQTFEPVLRAAEVFLLIKSGLGDSLGMERYLEAKALGFSDQEAFQSMNEFCRDWDISWKGLDCAK